MEGGAHGIESRGDPEDTEGEEITPRPTPGRCEALAGFKDILKTLICVLLINLKAISLFSVVIHDWKVSRRCNTRN